MEKVLLIGGGVHCASVIDTMNQQALYEPVGILDVPEKVGEFILDVPIVGVDSQMSEYFETGDSACFCHHRQCWEYQAAGEIGDGR